MGKKPTRDRKRYKSTITSYNNKKSNRSGSKQKTNKVNKNNTLFIIYDTSSLNHHDNPDCNNTDDY